MALSTVVVGPSLKEGGNMMLQPPQDMDPNYTKLFEKWPLQDITNNFSSDTVVDEASETTSFISNGKYNNENSRGKSTPKKIQGHAIGSPGAIHMLPSRGYVLRKGFR